MQELQYVVPFVAKVLESCAKSRVFKPPNPWTIAIMNALAELHREQDMKLHLKFEIEVLCNELELNVKASNYLKLNVRQCYNTTKAPYSQRAFIIASTSLSLSYFLFSLFLFSLSLLILFFFF